MVFCEGGTLRTSLRVLSNDFAGPDRAPLMKRSGEALADRSIKEDHDGRPGAGAGAQKRPAPRGGPSCGLPPTRREKPAGKINQGCASTGWCPAKMTLICWRTFPQPRQEHEHLLAGGAGRPPTTGTSGALCVSLQHELEMSGGEVPHRRAILKGVRAIAGAQGLS